MNKDNERKVSPMLELANKLENLGCRIEAIEDLGLQVIQIRLRLPEETHGGEQ